MNQGSHRWPWRAIVPAAAAGIALLAAACGGGSSPPAAGSSNFQEALAYAKCMRSHGAPGWPDPNNQGQFFKTTADSARFHAPASAYQACLHLLPDHGQITPAVQHQVTLLALKFAGGMRAHGIPDFPDPTGSGFEFLPPAGFDPHSPRVQAAQQACRSTARPQGNSFRPGKDRPPRGTVPATMRCPKPAARQQPRPGHVP
jgi:hypothetical protein